MDSSVSEGTDLRERANVLYWESEESVNQIADELDLSKGALYGLLEPLDSGLPCPRCSAGMEYPNRTARDKGFLACPECELEEDEEEVRDEWRAAARESESGTVVVRPGAGVVARRPDAPALDARQRRLVAAAALLGGAAGLAVVLWARRQ